MSVAQIIGVALAIAGVVFLIAGINATDAPSEQITEAFTGRYTQQTLWYIAGGLGALIGGGFLFLSRR